VTLTKSAPTAGTSTNWTHGHDAEDLPPNTSVDGENVSYPRNKLNWPHTNVTFNVSQKMEMTQKLKRIKIQDVGCRPYIGDEEGYARVGKGPPLQVYCDYEAITDE